MFGFIMFASIDNVALVFLVRDVLGGGSFGYGMATSAFGIGMIVATLALVRRSRLSPATLVLVGMLFTASGNLLVGVAPAIGLVIVFQTIGGVGNGLELVGEDTLLQQHVPGHLMGRVFGVVASAIFIGNTIAYAAGEPKDFREVYRAEVPADQGHWHYNVDREVRLEKPAKVVYLRYVGDPGVNNLRIYVHCVDDRPRTGGVVITHRWSEKGERKTRTVRLKGPGAYEVVAGAEPVNESVELAVPSR
jgi:hypothetical protein